MHVVVPSPYSIAILAGLHHIKNLLVILLVWLYFPCRLRAVYKHVKHAAAIPFPDLVTKVI